MPRGKPVTTTDFLVKQVQVKINKPSFQRSLFTAGAILLLSLTLGVRFYNEPQVTVGSKATETMLAPRDATVIDREATEFARENARRQMIQVYKPLEEVDTQVKNRLTSLLEGVGRLRRVLGPFPFTDTGLLTTESQRQLLLLTEQDWQLKRAQWLASERNATTLPPRSLPPNIARATPQVRQDLVTQVEAARQRYQQVQEVLPTVNPLIKTGGIVSFDGSNAAPLLDLSDAQWQSIQAQTKLITERILAMGVLPGVPEDMRMRGIRAQIPANWSQAERRVVLELVSTVLEPNLKVDQLATVRKIEREVLEVDEVALPIKKGQVLVQVGETVTPRLFSILDQLGLTQRGVNWFGLGVLTGILIFCVGIFELFVPRALQGSSSGEKSSRTRYLRREDQILILLLAIAVGLLGAVFSLDWTLYLPLSAFGLLVGSFYGNKLGFLALSCFLPPLIQGWNWQHPLYLLIPPIGGAFVAAWVGGRVRSRDEMALGGLVVSLVQGGLYLLIALLLLGRPLGWQLLLEATLCAASGLLWCIVALGVSPFLERLFDLVTPVRLVELANPNRPLLKRLATEAPGTYQHTLFVANLATAAAQAVGANVELVRAGTLYHDIGKMVRPLYFIENQMGLPNPHDELSDPERSAQMIKAHVADGLKLAKKFNLPQAIRDFIPEHQGTIQIAYFYHQAQQQNPETEIPKAAFTYDGPIPQSRETGLLMLADACEAALRSLADTGEEEAFGMVRRILQSRWNDGQLADSGLEEQELALIARIFVKVWKEQNHTRIRYPTLPNGSGMAKRRPRASVP
jgi:putative nucleotidyltransferase with HDIG domain